MTRLGQEEIERRLGDLDGWSHEGDAIVKEVKLHDFAGSIEFVNRLAAVAEELNHHPDISISWDTVRMSVTTHSQGGLTDSDFELARRIDAL